MASIRHYAIFYPKNRVAAGGGGAVAGGNALLSVEQHDLDGPEHTNKDILNLPTAETDTTLSLAPDGLGGVEFVENPGGGMVPYYIPVDGTFTVPVYRQALFYEPIEVDGALVVNGILQGVD